MTSSATFSCAACGNVAATVTLFDPGRPHPGQTPDAPGVPPGVGSILGSAFPDQAHLSIDGGPVPVAHGFVPTDKAAAAIEAGDAAALFAINPSTRRSGVRAAARRTVPTTTARG